MEEVLPWFRHEFDDFCLELALVDIFQPPVPRRVDGMHHYEVPQGWKDFSGATTAVAVPTRKHGIPAK